MIIANFFMKTKKNLFLEEWGIGALILDMF